MQHGRLSLRYYGFASPIDEILSLIVLLANLGFAPSDIRLMTDENSTPSWNLPNKENIVSHSCELSLLRLKFVQLGAMKELVYDAQPQDSFFVYCACSGLNDPTYPY